MKIKMIEGLELVITPESYVEQVALNKWVDENKIGTGLLIEAYKPLDECAAPDCEEPAIYNIWLCSKHALSAQPPTAKS